jgi:NAD(P)-dependent dehydrogenase (short-subunit alcohol dehydrogenase family)
MKTAPAPSSVLPVPDLSGKIALITGASRGIGAAVAKGAAAAGAHVVLVARTVGALEEIDDQIRAAGGQATLLPLDLMKLEEVDKIGPSIAERFGQLDILVGNAGILGPLSPVHQIKQRDWDKVMAVNFMANVRLVRSCDLLLRASPQGRIIFTISDLADFGQAYFGPYNASKAALDAFVKTYAAETQQTNMKINLLNPGIVATDMMKEAFPGAAPAGAKTPEAVVNGFLGLIGQDCSQHGTTTKI